MSLTKGFGRYFLPNRRRIAASTFAIVGSRSRSAAIERAAGHHPKYRPDAHVWFTGSGDSLFAAQAVLPGLERWAGLRATALTAMEFARYRAPLLTDRDILCAISNSGSAARTRETVSLARDKEGAHRRHRRLRRRAACLRRRCYRAAASGRTYGNRRALARNLFEHGGVSGQRCTRCTSLASSSELRAERSREPRPPGF